MSEESIAREYIRLLSLLSKLTSPPPQLVLALALFIAHSQDTNLFLYEDLRKALGHEIVPPLEDIPKMDLSADERHAILSLALNPGSAPSNRHIKITKGPYLNHG